MPSHQSSTLCLSHTEVNTALFSIDLLKSPSFRVPLLMLKMYTMNTTGTMVTSTGTLWYRTLCYCVSVMIWWSQSIQSIVHSLYRLAPRQPPTKENIDFHSIAECDYCLLRFIVPSQRLLVPKSPRVKPACAVFANSINGLCSFKCLHWNKRETKGKSGASFFLWQRGHTIFFYATTKTRPKCHCLEKGVKYQPLWKLGG